MRRTDYAILGLLMLKPMSGYDIKKTAAMSIGYFWNESYGQIYTSLKYLQSMNLIALEMLEKNRKLYCVTELGQASLKIWLAQDVHSPPIRNELLLKLFFGHLNTQQANLEHLNNRLHQLKSDLKTYQNLELDLKKTYATDHRLDFWLLTLDFGQSVAKCEIEWVQRSINLLNHKETGKKEVS